MRKEKSIKIFTPKPYQVVGVKFDLFGKVPKSWLSNGRYGLGADWLDSDGGNLPSSGPNATTFKTLFPWSRNVMFLAPVDLSYFTTSEHPRGLILVIETYGENNHSSYLPVIIAGTNKDYESEHAELKVKLSDTIQKIIQRKKDLENYTRELGELRKSIIDNREILEGVFEILEQSDEQFESYSEAEEDIQVAELEEKYKDAISARGPLFRGLAGKMEGFELRVYSDDHGRHFHVIHKGKGINARFSFPEIELLNYVSRTTIGSKTKKKIQEFCKSQEVFANLEKEFAKRFQTA